MFHSMFMSSYCWEFDVYPNTYKLLNSMGFSNIYSKGQRFKGRSTEPATLTTKLCENCARKKSFLITYFFNENYGDGDQILSKH